MKKSPHIVIFIGVLLAMHALVVPSRALSIDDAEGWERSAISRDDNAIALEEEANALVALAADFRDREFLYAAERRANMSRAGESELRAGELGMAAALHYEKASVNWSRAADVYGTLDDTEQQQNAETMAVSARDAAKLALTQAIGCFESAEEAFSGANAAEEVQKKIAIEKADEARNRLAELL